MTYYEELGLDPTATVKEIQRAYRRKARLIHPDQLASEETRRLAALQMKHLNAILTLLSEDGTRKDYDVSVLETRVHPSPPERDRRERTLFYAAAFLLVLLCAIAAFWPRP